MLCWDMLNIHRVIFRRSLLNQSDQNNSAINHSIFLKSPIFVSRRHDHSRKIRKISCFTKVFQLSSFPRSIKEWNKLPQLAVSTNDRTSKYPQKAFRDCGWIAILLWQVKYNLNLFFSKDHHEKLTLVSYTGQWQKNYRSLATMGEWSELLQLPTPKSSC